MKQNKLHPFDRMKQALQAEGWYVGWALPCCQTCAWEELPLYHEEGPFEGEVVEIHKVLFSHEQDCQLDAAWDDEKEEYILPEGYTKDDYASIPHYRYTETTGSLFCFAGDDEGVKNLLAAIPLIEAAGCSVTWDQSGRSRPYISWS